MNVNFWSLTILIFGLLGCEVFQVKKNRRIFEKSPNAADASAVVDSAGDTDAAYGTDTFTLTVETPRMGVRNYKQILESMSEKTKVDKNSASIQETFEGVMTKLATDTRASKFSAAHQAAVFKLATNFCAEGLNSEESKSHIFGELPERYVEILLEDNRYEISQKLVSNLWPAFFVDQDGMEETTTILSQLILDLDESFNETNPNANDDDRTQAVLVGACTSILASAPVTLYE